MRRDELLRKLALTITGIERSHPVLVGIDGIDGAGKTTLANDLLPFIERLNRKVARASIDGFHNPREKRTAKGVLSPEGYFEDSFDYDFLVQKFLKPLKRVGNSIAIRSAKFDFKTDKEVCDKNIVVDKRSIVLFEGVFLFQPRLDRFWDFKIFVDIEFGTSLARGLSRDSELLGGAAAAREKYMKRYIPGQKIYFQECRPKSKAHIYPVQYN